MQSRLCPNCGRPIPAQATSCGHCGARFQPSGQRAPARPSPSYPPDRPAQPSMARSRPPAPSSGFIKPPAPASGPVKPSTPASGPNRPPAPGGAGARPRTPTSPAARSRMPTRPVGGARQRQGAAPQPGRSGGFAAPTPDNGSSGKANNTRFILLIGALALVGIIIGGTIGVLAFTHKNAPTASATPTASPVNVAGTVSFTASGGLKGPFSASLPKGATAASYIQKGPTGKVLDVVVNSATLDFELGLSPYTGPRTYTLLPFQTNPTPGSFNGTVRISNHQTSWSLHPSAQCKVTVTSDTALNIKVQNTSLDEVKGTFACPTLTPDAGSAAPIAVTQGQFDVDALLLA